MQIVQIREGLFDYYKRTNPEYSNIIIENIERLSNGWNTLVYKFDITFSKEDIRHEKEFILRVYPGNEGRKKAAREFQIIANLLMTVVPVPDVYRIEIEDSPLDKPFIIMERIDGKPLSRSIINDPDNMGLYIQNFTKILSDLHQLDWQIVITNPEENQVDTPYKYLVQILNEYKDIIEMHDKKEFIPVLRWLVERMDTISNDKLSIIHNDFHFANVLLDNNSEYFAIDWINATVGDYRADLAWTLVIHETVLNKNIRDLIYNNYCSYSSLEVKDIEYFEVLAILRNILETALNFSFASEQARLNPDTVEKMKKQVDPVKRALDLLYAHTQIKIPEFEKYLVE